MKEKIDTQKLSKFRDDMFSSPVTKYKVIADAIINGKNDSINLAYDNISEITHKLCDSVTDVISVPQHNSYFDQIRENESVITNEFHNELSFYCLVINSGNLNAYTKGLHDQVLGKRDYYKTRISDCQELLSSHIIDYDGTLTAKRRNDEKEI